MFIDRIRRHKKAGLIINEAVDRAVVECIKEEILEEFLREHRAEVMNVFMTEYDEEHVLEAIRRDEREEGREEGRETERVVSVKNLIQVVLDMGGDMQVAVKKVAEKYQMEEQAVLGIWETRIEK